MTTRKRIFRITLAVLGGAMLLAQTPVFDATADGKPYSISLNSPATFPVDI